MYIGKYVMKVALVHDYLREFGLRKEFSTCSALPLHSEIQRGKGAGAV